MAESNAAPSRAGSDPLRTLTIILYGLYLLVGPTMGIALIAAVIVAYVKQDDARGTVYERHFSVLIETFWITLVLGVVGIITLGLGVGWLILIGLCVWFYYRAIRGILRAIDARPY